MVSVCDRRVDELIAPTASAALPIDAAAYCTARVGNFVSEFATRIVTPLQIGQRSIVMSVSVCVCVCVFVRDHIFATTRPIFTGATLP